jgi:cell division protein FtsZ
VQGVEFVCANTDAQALRISNAHKVIQLGSNRFGCWQHSRAKDVKRQKRLKTKFAKPSKAPTCCSSLPAWVVEQAPALRLWSHVLPREMGILTVGVVTKPFEFEGTRRMNNAEAGLAELEANVDSLIVVLNEKLLDVLGEDASQDDAFAFANDVLKNSVGGIAEIINVEAMVNVDFADVRTVMSETGSSHDGHCGSAMAQTAHALLLNKRWLAPCWKVWICQAPKVSWC